MLGRPSQRVIRGSVLTQTTMSSAPSREPLRLMQYAPMWGAPSLDAECTRVQAWLRFCGLLAGRDYVLEDCGPFPILQAFKA